jgi:hypothetical protein
MASCSLDKDKDPVTGLFSVTGPEVELLMQQVSEKAMAFIEEKETLETAVDNVFNLLGKMALVQQNRIWLRKATVDQPVVAYDEGDTIPSPWCTATSGATICSRQH